MNFMFYNCYCEEELLTIILSFVIIILEYNILLQMFYFTVFAKRNYYDDFNYIQYLFYCLKNYYKYSVL